MIIIIIFSVFAFYLVTKTQYEYNIHELEPKGLDSIILQKEITKKFKMSTEKAYVTTDSIKKAREFEKKLRKKRVVGDVVSISQLIPEDHWIEENDIEIARLRNNLSKNFSQNFSPKNINHKKKLTNQLQRLLYNIIEVEELSFIEGQDRVVAAFERLTGGEKQNGLLIKIVNRFQKGEVNWKGIDYFFSHFTSQMKTKLKQMTAYKGPVTENMIPEKLINLYKNSKTGLYLVQIYPKKNLYEREPLIRFNESVENVSSRITGLPKLIILINEATVMDGKKSLLLAALVILILLFLDLKSITTTILASIPLLFGALWMITMMSFLEIKFNIINIVAMPIIIGIGVDDGVHIVHRWQQEGFGGLKKSISKVGCAILMTSITTMIGFGSVVFYTHRGMASLGMVLLIGVCFCFLSTIVVFPAFGSFVENLVIKKNN